MNTFTPNSQMSIVAARAAVGRQMGLGLDFDGSMEAYRGLSADQQAELTRRLLDFIKNNPQRFTPQQNATAQAEAGRFVSFDTAQAALDSVTFMSELEKNAEEKIGKPLVAVGEGVSTSVKLLGNLLPILLIGAVVVIALPYINKARSTS